MDNIIIAVVLVPMALLAGLCIFDLYQRATGSKNHDHWRPD